MKDVIKRIPKWLKGVYFFWMAISLWAFANSPMIRRPGIIMKGDLVAKYGFLDFLFTVLAPALVVIGIYYFKKDKKDN